MEKFTVRDIQVNTQLGHGCSVLTYMPVGQNLKALAS
jgi:hypothetical protein